MLDPATLITIATSSVKLLVSGLKLAIWDGWTNWPARDRSTWLARLLDLGKDLIVALGDTVKAALPAPMKPETAAHLWAVHVACFGEALAEYWGGNQNMAGRGGSWGKWFAPKWVQERREELEVAFRFALESLPRLTTPGLPHTSWLAAPTTSPLYRALWSAFVSPGLTAGSVQLLPLEKSGDVQTFERAFAQAFGEAMVRSGNAELRALLSDTTPRRETLRKLLVTDMASWRYQHVFAGVDTSEGIPEMPLGTTYVEPTAVVSLDKDKTQGPVLEILEHLVTEHPVIFVSADFGHGKSLTARTLAWKWAEAYLMPGETPTADRIFPVHVRCHGDASSSWNLENVVRRALKRRADEIGVSVKLQDPALAPPPSEERTVYLLDGLDELILTDSQTKDLLRELFDQATDRHRFIVFSRPEALLRIRKDSTWPKIPHVKVQSFSEAQTDEWLWAWPRVTPSREDLKAHGLTELASVPILLFMLTLTWAKHMAHSGAIPRVQIYETFFQTLAAGKYEQGGETHPQIRAAAERARDALVDQRQLSPWIGEIQGRERAIEAMRWLMERVAWEAKRREFAGQALSRRHIENVLDEELKISEMLLEQVRVGLLLGMQAQFASEGQQFFFGHRSFMEFAIACYWERQLRRLCTTDRRELEQMEELLAGAPLHESDSRVFPMLCELFDRWSDEDCRALFEWAKLTVEDESSRPPRGERRATFRNDMRVLVRQSALAIGCRMGLRLNQLFDIGDGAVLLVISAWWIVTQGEPATVEAPRIHISSDSIMSGLVLGRANFSKSTLTGVDFYSNSFGYADFSESHMVNVGFTKTDLSDAKFVGAKMENGNFHKVNLDRADFSGAEVLSMYFEDVRLNGAKFAESTLAESMFTSCLFRATDFSDADLSFVDFSDEDLQGADFNNAKLHAANLTGATLSASNRNIVKRWIKKIKPHV